MYKYLPSNKELFLSTIQCPKKIAQIYYNFKIQNFSFCKFVDKRLYIAWLVYIIPSFEQVQNPKLSYFFCFWNKSLINKVLSVFSPRFMQLEHIEKITEKWQ